MRAFYEMTPTMTLLFFLCFSLALMAAWAWMENTKLGQKVGDWVEPFFWMDKITTF